MIVDEESRKLIDNVVKEDEILDLNITSAQPLSALPASR
jgi:syntaxin-binding protein 1